MFASGVCRPEDSNRPVSLTLPFSAPSQFTVTAAWQLSQTDLPFDHISLPLASPTSLFKPRVRNVMPKLLTKLMLLPMPKRRTQPGRFPHKI